MGSTDIDGLFYIKISDTTKNLLLFRGNYESGLIKLRNACDTLEIIMIWDDTYLGDFGNLGDSTSYSRNRRRQIKQLPELYNLAYERKIFKSRRICFEQIFDH